MAAGVQVANAEYSGAVTTQVVVSVGASERIVVHWATATDDGNGATVDLFIDETTDIPVLYGHAPLGIRWGKEKPRGIELGGNLVFTGGIAAATTRVSVGYSLVGR